MSVTAAIEVFETQQWPQGDVRDPLGMWGGRGAAAGAAGGGFIGGDFNVPADKVGSFVYACYGWTIGQTLGAAQAETAKIQLLTNFPNIDAQPGVQGFSTLEMGIMGGDTQFDSPFMGQRNGSYPASWRFILLYDPTPRNTPLTIVKLQTVNGGGVGVNFLFEAYGYYWDRSVLNAPGGPRHPGSS